MALVINFRKETCLGISNPTHFPKKHVFLYLPLQILWCFIYRCCYLSFSDALSCRIVESRPHDGSGPASLPRAINSLSLSLDRDFKRSVKNCEILNSGGNIFCNIKILYIFLFVNCFVHKKIIGEQEGGRKKFIGCQLFAGDKANTNCLDANTNLFVCTDKYTCWLRQEL